MHYRKLSSIAALITAAALAGCGKTEPPAFRVNMMRMVENNISTNHQQAIVDIVGAMFGTPNEPYAMPETGLDMRELKMAAGAVYSEKNGAKHGLYRRHCAHCHGINGDGHGPTAGILNPYPRDYRPGIFKFKSTYTAAQPTDEDLRRIISNGIPGTAMPAFALLPPDEIDALVEYVKYLSMRGQVENALIAYVADEGLEPDEPLDPATDPELKDIIVNDLLTEVTEPWQAATENIIVPTSDMLPPDNRPTDEILASVHSGRELFYGSKANCVKCHGPTGLGDGQQDNYDDWSEAIRKFNEDTSLLAEDISSLRKDLSKLKGDERQSAEADIKEKSDELAKREALQPYLLTPRRAIPRDLRLGSYRGGRRPVDLFWRIYAGIPGMGMPAHGASAPGGQGPLNETEMWQIIDYISSLPFEPISLPQTRQVNIRNVN